ncbi:hypothetical protein [Fuscovulum ytuae]|uniref:Uncharacterized protein n=1 Tax=Fuscovulum ytuae TaxID=3042299 RepID=A0ABY8Q939_9RHOB|nr:hypothetical protein [Fuscovulum sp. YMD61]WGV17209.1 hypothetical protein QF092_05230 [Fuscovulum sp. YMD61]
MSFAQCTTGGRLAALAVLAMLPMAAQAELRPAVLPDEICLVLSNGPFDANVAAILQRRGDYADILLLAENNCPELAGTLVGATASIPTRSAPNNDTGGPSNAPTVPPTIIVTPPVEEEPDLPPDPDPEPPEERCPDPVCDGPTTVDFETAPEA